MTPLQQYHHDLVMNGFTVDASQQNAIQLLQKLYEVLLSCNEKNSPNWYKYLKSTLKRTPQSPVRGLYLWGGVGRGKTYLMDTFYECLPFTQKQRMHFHRFMQWLHQKLTQHKGQKDPLRIIARNLAKNIRVLCFDEFYVSDVADAMLLGTLLRELFAHQVTLVITSNIPPTELYKNGVQRHLFISAIEALETHAQVFHLEGGIDYRLRELQQTEIYHSPLDERAHQQMLSYFNKQAMATRMNEDIIEINQRQIKTIAIADGILWCDFAGLCDGPRSQNDYIEISRIYHTVLLSNVPALTNDMDDQARRFISLVDEFYDRHVKLIISVAVQINELYTGRLHQFEFKRTTSRLLEMQSENYLAKMHIS